MSARCDCLFMLPILCWSVGVWSLTVLVTLLPMKASWQFVEQPC